MTAAASPMIGNPFLNSELSWTQKFHREWEHFTSRYLCTCNFQELDIIEKSLLGEEDDIALTSDRVHYNRASSKLVAESDSWFSGYSQEIPTNDMDEDEIIEQYTTIGFKVVSNSDVGVTLQKMDHTESSKHLYHIDDRRALGYQI
mmetsp:Transcript_31815/g.48797  ORF Transcript_31815/g.48797 Transcript_31815/m.48797 type:complete len:146 (+) Transcript_31815:63-500(+)